jgi:predicted Zn-dependent protease with MMP-like domain
MLPNITREEFDKYVDAAARTLPKEFRELLDNVNLFIEDWPSDEQIMKFRLREEKIMLLGLYEGVPRTRRGVNYGVGGHLPDKITLFRIPIIHQVRSVEELKSEVKETLFHEIGHYFGMSEEDIDKAKEKSKKSEI